MTIANIITASAAAMGVATSIINQAEALDANHPRLRKLDADDTSSLSLSMPSKVENIDNVGSALIEEVEPKSSLEAVDTGILSSKASKSSKGGKGSKTCPLDESTFCFLLHQSFTNSILISVLYLLLPYSVDGDGSDGIIAANAAGRCYLSAEKGGLDGYVCRNKPCVYSCDCFGSKIYLYMYFVFYCN